MLAAEVLVEAVERLARQLHHLLHRKVPARPRIGELDGCIQKALYPAFGP